MSDTEFHMKPGRSSRLYFYFMFLVSICIITQAVGLYKQANGAFETVTYLHVNFDFIPRK